MNNPQQLKPLQEPMPADAFYTPGGSLPQPASMGDMLRKAGAMPQDEPMRSTMSLAPATIEGGTIRTGQVRGELDWDNSLLESAVRERPRTLPDYARLAKRAGAAAVNATKQGIARMAAGMAAGHMAEMGDPLGTADKMPMESFESMAKAADEPAIDMGPPETFWDKVADTAGTLVPTVAELLGMNVLIPGGGMARAALKSPTMAGKALGVAKAVGRGAALFEAQSLAHGVEPGHGATMGGIFTGIEVIPGASVPAKLAKTILESVAMGTAAKLQGGDAEDIAIAAGTPLGIKAGSAAMRGMSRIFSGETPLPDKPTQADMRKLGIDLPDPEQRKAFATAVESILKPRMRLVRGDNGTYRLEPAEPIPAMAAGSTLQPEANVPPSMRQGSRPEPQGEQAPAFDAASAPLEAVKAQATELGVKVGGLNEAAIRRKVGAKLEPSYTKPSHATGFIPLDGIADAIGKGLDAANALRKTWLTSRGNLPEDVFEASVLKDGKIAGELQQAAFHVRDLKAASKELFGSKQLPPDEALKLDAAMKGELPWDQVPDAIRKPAQVMRAHMDALSDRLIASGAIEGRLVPAVEANKGVYMHRSYRAFDDPAWADKVPVEIRNRAKALIRSEFPTWSEEQIEGKIRSLLFEGKAAEDGPIAVLRNSKLGGKKLDLLKRRNLDEPAIRDLFGEYKDPLVNYTRSVARMSHLLANQEFLTNVRANGIGRYFHEAPLANEAGNFVTRIAAEGSSTMRPLSGLYTTPDLKAAFDAAFSNQAMQNRFLRGYMRANAAVKLGKTVWSSATQARNFMANALIRVAQGDITPQDWAAAHHAAKAITAKHAGNDTKLRGYVKRATELGVLGQEVEAGMLRDMIRDYARSADPLPHDGVFRKVSRGVQEAYKTGDDFWKLIGWENEKARYRKAFPEWSEAQLEAHAARIVQDTMPTYSRVFKLIKEFRKAPILGNFTAFPTEIARTSYNTLALIKSELAEARTRAIGARRLAGAMVAATLPAAVAAFSRNMLGVTRDREEDIRRLLPEWSRNSDLFLTGRSGTRFDYVDLSYLDPYAILKKPLAAFMRGDDWEASIVEAAGEFLSPYLDENILTGAVVDVARNSTKRGQRVYNPQDDGWTKIQKGLAHIAKAGEPGIVATAKRISGAATGKPGSGGQPYDMETEILGAFGHRISTVDVPRSLQFRSRDYARAQDDARSMLTSEMRRKGVTSRDIKAARDNANQAGRRVFDELHRTALAAIRLGMTEDQVRNTLRNSNLSKQQADAILAGKYLPESESVAGWLLWILTEPKPERKAGESRRDYDARLQRWSDERQDAAERLHALNLSPADQRRLLQAELRKRGLRTDGRAAAKRLRQLGR